MQLRRPGTGPPPGACRSFLTHACNGPRELDAAVVPSKERTCQLERLFLTRVQHVEPVDIRHDGVRQRLEVAADDHVRLQLARHTGAHALVTGDVVGQVASQTIDNLSVIDEAATMPILRPLVGFDKEEITIEAQRLGTYGISVVPDEDCCRLFTPQFPATRASLSTVQAAEAELDTDGLVAGAIDAAVVEEFRFPVLRLAAPTVQRGETQ